MTTTFDKLIDEDINHAILIRDIVATLNPSNFPKMSAASAVEFLWSLVNKKKIPPVMGVNGFRVVQRLKKYYPKLWNRIELFQLECK